MRSPPSRGTKAFYFCCLYFDNYNYRINYAQNLLNITGYPSGLCIYKFFVLVSLQIVPCFICNLLWTYLSTILYIIIIIFLIRQYNCLGYNTFCAESVYISMFHDRETYVLRPWNLRSTIVKPTFHDRRT